MAASGRRALAAAAIALLASTLAGCVSTQRKNERARVIATRELESRRAQRPGAPDPRMRVVDVGLVRGRRTSAIVVALRSRASTPLTDVPITVGLSGRGGHRAPLNTGAGLGWFQTHVPSVAAGGDATWVFVTRRPLPAGVRPWARVGRPADSAAPARATMPRIEAAWAGSDRPSGPSTAAPSARVTLVNVSDVPQYDLQVYATARRGARWIAAGRAVVPHLGTGKRTTARIALVGRASGRQLRLHAVPTIFE